MDLRPSRDLVLTEVAKIIALRGTCTRAQVGVVVAREGRILVTGYNGAPSHMDHCNHECTCTPDTLNKYVGKDEVRVDLIHKQQCPAGTPCTVAVHGEANAIAYAARYGIALEGADLYTTLAPCLPCAQLIINSGIVRVLYRHKYRDEHGIQLLEDAQIILNDSI